MTWATALNTSRAAAVEAAWDMDRNDLIAVLMADDPNGVYCDDDCVAEDMPCMGEEEARNAVLDIIDAVWWMDAACPACSRTLGGEYADYTFIVPV